MTARVLFFTGGFTHALHREAFQATPSNVEYLAGSPQLLSRPPAAEIARRGRGPFPSLGLKRVALAAVAAMGVPRVRRVRAAGCDLIHSAQDLLITHKPWVVEVEDVSSFFWYRRDVLSRTHARRVAERILSSENCRAVLPWTYASQRSLFAGLRASAFENKVTVVYPCAALRAPSKGEDSRFTLLFVGSTFFTKGGVETLEAFTQLHEPRARLVMVAPVPREYRERFGADSRITFLSGISDEQLEHCYRHAHAFVLPVHTDTFGFVFLEAFARGLPCVSTTHFAVQEIVTHGQNGIVVQGENSYFDERGLPRFDPVLRRDHPLVQQICKPSEAYISRLRDAMATLAGSAELTARLGAGAREEVATGRFSVARRRARLAEIYAAVQGTTA